MAPDTSANFAATISPSTFTRSKTSTLRTGNGAVFYSGRQERKGGLRSSVRPRRSGENTLGWCRRAASPILPHRTREGWGNQIEVLIGKHGPAPKQIVVDSSHEMPTQHPEVVISAIHDVWLAARA